MTFQLYRNPTTRKKKLTKETKKKYAKACRNKVPLVDDVFVSVDKLQPGSKQTNLRLVYMRLYIYVIDVVSQTDFTPCSVQSQCRMCKREEKKCFAVRYTRLRKKHAEMKNDAESPCWKCSLCVAMCCFPCPVHQVLPEIFPIRPSGCLLCA